MALRESKNMSVQTPQEEKKIELKKEEVKASAPAQEANGQWFFTPEKKLKDTNNRNYVLVPLKDFFGFVPEIVGVFKIPGRNNVVTLGAFMPAKKKLEIEKIPQSGTDKKTDEKRDIK